MPRLVDLQVYQERVRSSENKRETCKSCKQHQKGLKGTRYHIMAASTSFQEHVENTFSRLPYMYLALIIEFYRTYNTCIRDLHTLHFDAKPPVQAHIHMFTWMVLRVSRSFAMWTGSQGESLYHPHFGLQNKFKNKCAPTSVRHVPWSCPPPCLPPAPPAREWGRDLRFWCVEVDSV